MCETSQRQLPRERSQLQLDPLLTIINAAIHYEDVGVCLHAAVFQSPSQHLFLLAPAWQNLHCAGRDGD
jgi:hypothetical protein